MREEPKIIHRLRHNDDDDDAAASLKTSCFTHTHLAGFLFNSGGVCGLCVCCASNTNDAKHNVMLVLTLCLHN